MSGTVVLDYIIAGEADMSWSVIWFGENGENITKDEGFVNHRSATYFAHLKYERLLNKYQLYINKNP